MLEKLFQGVKEFQQEDFEKHRKLFESLYNNQDPHTLFIGCCDSRVVPSMITRTAPGELFIIRNIANIVPPYKETEEFVSTIAAIEYALHKINIKNIVICGHSNCGGCEALYLEEEKTKDIPNVKKWLELAGEVKKRVSKIVPANDIRARDWMTEQLNVVLQIEHLLTYPGVKKRVKEGSLNILGWHYIIQTGEIYNYSFEKRKFELLRENDIK